MQVEQISVILENNTGWLSEVTAILTEAKINIRALALADTSDFGVFHHAGINVEYMYAFVRSSGSNAVMIFRIEQQAEAVGLLESKGVTVLDGQRLYSI